MPRPHLPLHIPDLSAFARRLAAAHEQRQDSAPDDEQGPPADLPAAPRLPGPDKLSHVQWLNLLAKAAGHRNFQSLRAFIEATAHDDTGPDPWAWAPTPSSHDAPEAEAADEAGPSGNASSVNTALSDAARKALSQFDAQGRLVRWPVKYSVQQHILWMLWTRFDAKRTYTEPEVNAILKAAHTYGDHATLRRELVNHRLLSRTSDCREYRKCTRRPDAGIAAMLGLWREQHRGSQGGQRPAPGQVRLRSVAPELQSPPRPRPAP